MKLDGLVYLREITSGNFENVSEFIEYITTDENGNVNPEGKINETKIRIAERDYQISTLEAAGKFEEADKIRKEYSGDNVVNFEVKAINNGAMQKTVDMIRDDDELLNLKVSYTSGEYQQELMENGADKYCTDGLTAACFEDSNGNAYVIYRGTDGYIAWLENTEAATLADTEYQQKALNFFESIPKLTMYNDVQLSGHSKGGNMVQYITVVSKYSEYISKALSYDGQGFSEKFLLKYFEEIQKNKDKIVSYSAEFDVVNGLLYELDIERHYIKASIADKNPFNHHYWDVVFNENNQLNYEVEESQLRRQVNALIIYIYEGLSEKYDPHTVEKDIAAIGKLLSDYMNGLGVEISEDLATTIKHLDATGMLKPVISSLDQVLVDWADEKENEEFVQIAIENALADKDRILAVSLSKAYGALLPLLKKFGILDNIENSLSAEDYIEETALIRALKEDYKSEVHAIVEKYTTEENAGFITDYITKIFSKFLHNKIVGTPGNDNLDGDDFDNYIYGLPGNDYINGFGGDDVINGGDGDDVIFGGDDSDLLYGGNGNDHIYGNDGVDFLDGGMGNDYLDGGENNDSIIGDDGDDIIVDLYGDNKINGGNGNDNIKTGSGIDTIFGGSGDDEIYSGDGDDTIEGNDGNDTIYGEGGRDTIYGGNGNDYIDGGDELDKIFGEAGDDTIYGGGMTDYISGGDGDDWIDGGLGIDLLFGDDGDDIIFGRGDKDHIEGGNGNDHLYGGDGDDEIYGDSEDDSLGYTGDDILYGDSGNDKLFGGDGNDELHGGNDDDELFGGEGNDYLDGDDGDDYLEGGNGLNHMYGGEGDDVFVGGEDTDYMYGEDGNDVFHGGNGPNYMYGGEGDDNFTGGEGFDYIEGGSGNDTMNGGNGYNVMHGGTGIDYIYGGENADHIYGDEGNDHLYGGNGNNMIRGGFGNDIIYDGNDSSRIFGDEGNDTIYAGGGNDVIDPGEGDDYIQDDHGDDTIIFKAGYGTDTISDAAGNNTIQLSGLSMSDAVMSRINGSDLKIGFGSDNIIIKQYFDGAGFQNFNINGTMINDLITTLHGSDSNDWMSAWSDNGVTIKGEGGNDTINGGNGDDILDGGTGNDWLYGGNGNDTYIFGKGYGNDTIEDWGGSSLVKFTDINIDEVSISKLNDSTLVLTIDSTGDTLTVNGYKWNQGGYIFEFADGTTDSINKDTWKWESGFGSTAGEATQPEQNIINGTAGSDNLYGTDSNDILDGGEGNDTLCGGNGEDTYIFAKGYGNDTVNEWSSDHSVIQLKGINSDEVTITDQWGSNLILFINGTEDTLTINNFKWGQSSYTFKFADGAVGTVNKDTWELELSQPASNDAIVQETSEEEIIQASADLLSDMYADDNVTSELLTETSGAVLIDSSSAVSAAKETEETADQTDIQVMILTENMSAFGTENNVSDCMSVNDPMQDTSALNQLLVGTQAE